MLQRPMLSQDFVQHFVANFEVEDIEAGERENERVIGVCARVWVCAKIQLGALCCANL
jgi:hypothetical protein